MSFPTDCSSDGDKRVDDSFFFEAAFLTSITIAVLAPVAVTGNALILAAIWKKTFVRTPFHILLSGLAFTDLCTGLIAQTFYSAATFMSLGTTRIACDKSKLITSIRTIGAGSAICFIATTVFLNTLISIERWLHMSRRSLVTSRRGCFIVITLLLFPFPAIVLRVLANKSQTWKLHEYSNNSNDAHLLSRYVICLF